MDTKLEKLNKLLEIIKDDTVKPSDIQKFLVVILDVIKKSKENFDNLSAENIKTIQDSVSYLEENYKKWEVSQDDKTKSILSGFDAKIASIDALSKELKKSIDEVKAIEIKDGQDADEEVIVAKVLKEIKLPEYKEVILDNGEEIVVKINDINSKEDKYKIDFSHIKNVPSPIIQGSNISKSVYQLQDVVLTNLANNDTLKWDSTNKYWVNGTGSGSSISLLTNGIPNASQTILNLVQGSGMTINDLGGGIIEFSAIVSPAGAPGNIQYYDSVTGLTAGATNSFFDNTTGDYYLPNLAGFMNADISKAVKYDATGLTAVRTHTIPNATGTYVLSVNGTAPDAAGDVTIAAGGSPGGSNTQLQYNNSGSFGGISGATTNGTSVTYTTGNLLVADVKASGSSGVQILSNSGTVTALFGAGGGANSTFYGGIKGDYLTASNLVVTDASKNLVSLAILTGDLGGTGVANTGKTITLGGNLTTTGAFNTTFAASATATYTLPTSTSTLLANNLGLSGGTTYIGGTAATDKVIFQSTSGNQVTGTATQFLFKGGNNGATTLFGIGDGLGTNIGELGLWAAGQTSSTNHFLRAGTNFTYVNAGTDLRLQVGAVDYIDMLSGAGTVSIRKPMSFSGTGTNFTLPAGTTTMSPMIMTSGTNKTTPAAGEWGYDGTQLQFTNGGAQRQEIPQIQQSRVSTQFDKTSDTTLANITGLTATVVAGKIYRFEAILFTSSNVAGGVKVAIAGTATATAIVYEGLTTDAGLTTQTRATALGTAVGGVTAVTAGFIKIYGTITVNAAGTLRVQFAQNASNGTASSVLVGSTFVLTQML